MDIGYLMFWQNLREMSDGVFDSFMLKVTEFGEPALTFLLLAFIYWCVDKRMGQLMGFNISIACSWNLVLKRVFQVERPWVRDRRITPVPEAMDNAGDFSMPSGHTARATAAWGSLGYCYGKKKEKLLSLICFGILALVLCSRNYLGVHGLLDVLAALVTGMLLVFWADRILKWAEGGKNRDLMVGMAGMGLCLLTMVWTDFQPEAGAGAGFFAGWMLERRLVRFEIDGRWKVRGIRFAVGVVGILFILNALPNILGLWMETGTAEFVSMFILLVFIIAVYPFFFADRKRYRAGGILLFCCLLVLTNFSCGEVKAQRMGIHSGRELDNVAAAVVEEASNPAESPAQGDASASAQEENGSGTQPIWLSQEEPVKAEKEVLVIAEGGYSSVFPENTLAAFAGAVEIGADYVGMDVQMAQDGEPLIWQSTELAQIDGEAGRVTLKEALELVRDSGSQVCLELKDMGKTEDFAEAVLEVVSECGMTERCIFASYCYEYLVQLKRLNGYVRALYRTDQSSAELPEEFPSDLYGFNPETVTAATVKAVQAAGRQIFVWNVDTPEQMDNMKAMGVDGICTSRPGLARVALQPEYGYLVDRFEDSVTIPGLYESESGFINEAKVMRGLTQAGNYLVVSAWCRSEEGSSILYLMDQEGEVKKTVELTPGLRIGNISYDEAHDLLWMMDSDGLVYAVSWNEILNDTWQGEMQVRFEPELTKEMQEESSCFMTIYGEKLFVGCSRDGEKGLLSCYDLADVQNPALLLMFWIPERVHGITFWEDVQNNKSYLLMSQQNQGERSSLLIFSYRESISEFDMPLEVKILPEGAEQIEMTVRGLYLLFNPAYGDKEKISNDQIFLIRK